MTPKEIHVNKLLILTGNFSSNATVNKWAPEFKWGRDSMPFAVWLWMTDVLLFSR